MFTQAKFVVSNPKDPRFKDVPEGLEPQYRDRIQRELRIVKGYSSQAVHVDFRNETVYGPPRACGARDPIGNIRVCVITLSGLMRRGAVRFALAQALFEQPKPAVDINVSWRLQKPAALQRAA